MKTSSSLINGYIASNFKNNYGDFLPFWSASIHVVAEKRGIDLLGYDKKPRSYVGGEGRE